MLSRKINIKKIRNFIQTLNPTKVIEASEWKDNVDAFDLWKAITPKMQLSAHHVFEYRPPNPKAGNIVRMGSFFVRLVSNNRQVDLLNDDQRRFLAENFVVIE
jgi:hypothetical protein